MSLTHPHDHDHSHSHKHHSHGGGHGHHGHHGHHHGAIGNIRLAFFLNLGFSLLEIIGGIWIGSMAIVADAIHDFGDSISLGGAWLLERYANKSRDDRFNFGYRRFSLLSALISGAVILVGSTIIIYESIHRFGEAKAPAGIPMIVFAIFGLAVNGFAAWRLSHGATQNEKLLTWHLLEDFIGWAVVLVGAIIIALTGITWIDPLLAIGMSIFVLFNVLKHLRDTAYLFLQGRPDNFNEALFLEETMKVSGVEKVDRLAVWSLDGETSVLSLRVHLHSVRDPLEIEGIKHLIRTAAEKQNAQATLETCLAEHKASGCEE